MSNRLDPNKDLVPFEELTMSNMWEVAALVEVLERKGVLHRQEIFAMINELRKRTPEAATFEAPPKRSVKN